MFEYNDTVGALGWQLVLQFAWVIAFLGLVALVTLVYVAPRMRTAFARAFAGRSLRSSLLITTSLVGILPALTTAIVLAERSANARYEQIASRLADSATVAANEVDLFIDKHIAAVTSAAGVISAHQNPSDDTMFRWLTMYHDIYQDFLTMLTADQTGDIRTATVLLNGKPAAVSELNGQNVADRPYFKQPMATGTAFVSDVFRGRGLGDDPIVAVSAPLENSAGERFGILEGSLNLRAFARIEKNVALLDDAVMLILDEKERVIFASPKGDFGILESLAGSMHRTGVTAYADNVTENVFETADFVAAQARSGNGWRVIIRVPASAVQMQTSKDYRLAALLMLFAAAIGIGLATIGARRVTSALDNLNESIDAFTLEGSGANFEIPIDTPAEFIPVLDHMRSRSQHLRATHERLTQSLSRGAHLTDQLERVISEKESEISARTRELQEANDRLEDLSRRDGLTGIANRRGYDTFDARIRRLCEREKTPIATVMIDIDFFKQYNDRFGHEAGDVCLKQVAEALESCAQRPLDLVARFGGEEFIAVLGATRIASAVIVAERMRCAIRDLNISHPDSSHGFVTVSVGVAGVAGGEVSEPSRARKEADRALYAAKSDGRDAVFYAVGEVAYRYDEQQIISDTAIHEVRQVRGG